jgi:hypothetical protein
MLAKNILRYILYNFPLPEYLFFIRCVLNISDTNIVAKERLKFIRKCTYIYNL